MRTCATAMFPFPPHGFSLKRSSGLDGLKTTHNEFEPVIQLMPSTLLLASVQNVTRCVRDCARWSNLLVNF